MALLTSASDIEDAGCSVVDIDADVLSHLIAAASDLVIGYLGAEPNPVPDAVSRVVADMVVAVLTKPDVTTAQYDAGGYNQIREATSVRVGIESATGTGPWLTKSLKTRLAPYRTGGMRSVSMTSERT